MAWGISSDADVKAFESGDPVGAGYGGFTYSVPVGFNLVI
jgi:hypothetical protein